MKANHHERVFAVFDRLRALPVGDRAQALSAEAGLDEHERRSVETLLAHDTPTGEFLGGQLEHATAGLWAAAEPQPASIGPYRVLRLLGRGGFGRVYLAEESHPQRLVAVKVMRPLHGPSEARRFEFEAQALARLEHPGIARVYACGTDAALGQVPYIAMEYVDGPTIDALVRDLALDTSARLRLLIALCRAVAHAHLHGVLHRDLSPKNILVDRQGQPKIVDFGLAKPLERSGDMRSLHTADGTMLGTLHAMSPEQLAGGSRKADARSDVYALGLVCWEVMTGEHPFADDQASIGTLVARLLAAPLPRVAGVHRAVRGDLRVVLSAALERDPLRRYQSAGALADDLEAVLERRPVRARKPGIVYLMRTLANRHRGPAIAALLGLVAAVALAISWGVSVQRELGARAVAINALDAVVSRVLGPMAPKLGTLEEREVLLRSIEPDLLRVLAKESNEPQMVRLEARFFGALADVLRERDLYVQALPHQIRSTDALRRLYDLTDGDLRVGHEYSIGLVKLGDAVKELGDSDGAYAWYGKAFDLDQTLLRRAPDDLGILSNLFWSLTRIEDREITTGAGDGSHWREREAAVAHTMRQIDAHAWRSLEASVYSEFRFALHTTEFEHYWESMSRAIDAAGSLAALDPSMAKHQAVLVYMATRAASRASDEGRVDLAREAIEVCGPVLEAMRAAGPLQYPYFSYSGAYEFESARIFLHDGRYAEALELLDDRMSALGQMIDRGDRGADLLIIAGKTLLLQLQCAAGMQSPDLIQEHAERLAAHLQLCAAVDHDDDALFASYVAYFQQQLTEYAADGP